MEKMRKNFLGGRGEQTGSVPLRKIRVNPEQPRKVFSDESLEELTGSIKEYGVLQPVILSDDGSGGTYTVIAGERRLRAAQLAGLEKIPAIIRKVETKEAALIALVENVQREDLSFLEEARAYKKLMDDFHLTQSEIAEKVNKRQSTISNKIRILSLPEAMQEQIAANRLTERHARALLRITEDCDRQQMLERVLENNLNVKQTEKLIEEFLKKKEAAERKRRKVNYISYKIYLNTIRKTFRQIKEMEKNAKMEQVDKGDFMEVKIILPKNDRCFT